VSPPFVHRLRDATKRGDVEAVNVEISRGVNVNECDLVRRMVCCALCRNVNDHLLCLHKHRSVGQH